MSPRPLAALGVNSPLPLDDGWSQPENGGNENDVLRVKPSS
jgi:hypothetical protein